MGFDESGFHPRYPSPEGLVRAGERGSFKRGAEVQKEEGLKGEERG